jgi:hypothetical protein
MPLSLKEIAVVADDHVIEHATPIAADFLPPGDLDALAGRDRRPMTARRPRRES